MATLRLEIVTPEGISFSGDVDMVYIPGEDGELGVMPQHVPVVVQLAPGELRAFKSSEETRLAVGSGVAEITQQSVAVLTDMAVKESEIDEAAAEEAIRRAEAAMRDEKLEGEELATVQAAIQKSLAQLRVKRRRVI